MDTRHTATHDPLVIWDVGYAHEWPADIVTADHVAAALRKQAADSDWDIDADQLRDDAEVIADWLHDAREVTS